MMEIAAYDDDSDLMQREDCVPPKLKQSTHAGQGETMWKLAVATVICGLTISLARSEAPRLDLSDYSIGGYATFEEFLTNSPSVRGQFNNPNRFDSQEYAGDWSRGNLTYVDSTGREVKYEGRMWGYFDGYHVYIGHLDRYRQLVPMPVVSLFAAPSELSYLGSMGSSPGSPFGSPVQAKHFKTYMLLMKTGQVLRLTKRNLESVLENDPELLEKFGKARRKRKRLEEFLLLYVERNRKVEEGNR